MMSKRFCDIRYSGHSSDCPTIRMDSSDDIVMLAALIQLLKAFATARGLDYSLLCERIARNHLKAEAMSVSINMGEWTVNKDEG